MYDIHTFRNWIDQDENLNNKQFHIQFWTKTLGQWTTKKAQERRLLTLVYRLPSKSWPVQSQQFTHKKKVWNMLKINNKDTRTMSCAQYDSVETRTMYVVLFSTLLYWTHDVLVSLLSTLNMFYSFFRVSIANFGKLNVNWAYCKLCIQHIHVQSWTPGWLQSTFFGVFIDTYEVQNQQLKSKVLIDNFLFVLICRERFFSNKNIPQTPKSMFQERNIL